MRPVRGFQAFVATVGVLVAVAGCTDDESADADGGRTAIPTITTPDAPSLEVLLAAPAEAVEALNAEYPGLVVIDTVRYDRATSADVYERYGFEEGVLLEASIGAWHSLLLRFDVFADHDSAGELLALNRERSYVDELVEVPGWPEVANFRVVKNRQDIWYGFVHGRAVVHLILEGGRFDSPEEAAAELGAALDIVQASLNETVPITE